MQAQSGKKSRNYFGLFPITASWQYALFGSGVEPSFSQITSRTAWCNSGFQNKCPDMKEGRSRALNGACTLRENPTANLCCSRAFQGSMSFNLPLERLRLWLVNSTPSQAAKCCRDLLLSQGKKGVRQILPCISVWRLLLDRFFKIFYCTVVILLFGKPRYGNQASTRCRKSVDKGRTMRLLQRWLPRCSYSSQLLCSSNQGPQ